MFDPKQRAYSEWLVVRCQQGDKTAFRTLVELWEGRLIAYAVRRLSDPEAAKDVAQECLLAVSKGLRNLKDPGAFPKWLFQILERRCVDNLRRKIREREIVTELDSDHDVGREDNIANELSVASMLNSFDPAVRLVLQLHYLDGFTVTEIAEIVNVPSGTVKSRLFYARKTLMKRFKEKTRT